MKLGEFIKQTIEQFKTAGIDSSQLDAYLLAAHVLQKDKSFIISHSDYELSTSEILQLKNMVEKRKAREPISQILGYKEFYGHDFSVSQDVLTPRPETEFIITAALELFNKEQELNVLDLGVGSGAVILTLAAEFKNSHCLGVDISNAALAIARKNAYDLRIENARFINSNWCKNLGARQKFNLIVSNPPYIPVGHKDKLDAELKFEPETALFAGDDGLECYRQIANEISNLEFDFAIFEIGMGQESEVKKIFEGYKINLIKTLPDLAGIPRAMVFKK